MDKPGGQIGQGPTTVTRGARVPLEDGSFVGSGLIILEQACPNLVEAVVFSPTSTFDNNEDLLWSSHRGPSTLWSSRSGSAASSLSSPIRDEHIVFRFNAFLLRRVSEGSRRDPTVHS